VGLEHWSGLGELAHLDGGIVRGRIFLPGLGELVYLARFGVHDSHTNVHASLLSRYTMVDGRGH